MENNKMSAEEILEKNSTFHFRSKKKLDPNDIVWNICPRDALKAMNEYTASLQKQIEERDKEIYGLNQKLSLLNFAYKTEKENYESLWSKLSDSKNELTLISNTNISLLSQLSQKDEMIEMMAEAIRQWNDGDPILTEYQNSKK